MIPENTIYMANLRIFLIAGLILNVAAIDIMDINSDGCVEVKPVELNRLSNEIEPLHYDIKLTLDILHDERGFFLGECNITIHIRRPIRNITLHSRDLITNKVPKLIALYDNVTYLTKAYLDETHKNTLILQCDAEVPIGIYILHIAYGGIINNDDAGLFKTTYKNQFGQTKRIFATRLKPNYARQVFPCWDEPNFQSTFSITVIHCLNCTVLSNMPILRQHSLEDMWHTTFVQTPLISTYLLGIVLLEEKYSLYNFNQTNIWSKINYSDYDKINTSADISQRLITFFSNYTDSNPKTPRLQYVIIPNFPLDTIKYLGLIIYR